MFSSEEKQAFAAKMRRNPTKGEAALWHQLKDRKLSGLTFHAQEVICGFIVDFVCFERKLVIEVDGSSHVGREAYDARRTKALEKLGFKVIRFTNHEVSGMTTQTLERMAKDAGLPPGFIAPAPKPARPKKRKRRNARQRRADERYRLTGSYRF